MFIFVSHVLFILQILLCCQLKITNSEDNDKIGCGSSAELCYIPNVELTPKQLSELKAYQNTPEIADGFYNYSNKTSISVNLTDYEMAELKKLIVNSEHANKAKSPVENNDTFEVQKIQQLFNDLKVLFGDANFTESKCNETHEKLGCPFIYGKSRSKHAIEGETVSLECTAVGVPQPKILWFQNDSLIQPNSKFTFYNDLRILKINQVTTDDTAIYQCRAINPIGFDLAKFEISVNEIEKPQMLVPPVSQDVIEGGNAVFDCVLSGQPVPYMVWFFRGNNGEQKQFNVPRSEKGNYAHSIKYEEDRIISEGTRLIITNTKKVDEGLYICVASLPKIDEIVKMGAYLEVTPFSDKHTPDKEMVLKFIRAEEARLTQMYKRSLFVNQYQINKKTTLVEKMRRLKKPDIQIAFSDIRRQVLETTIRKFYHSRRMRGYSPSLKIGARAAPVLSVVELDRIMNSSQCIRREEPKCDPKNTFYENDGSCNHIENPTRGQSGRNYKRLLYPDYEDGFSTPTGYTPHLRYFGFRKPPPRTVSMLLLAKHTHVVSEYETDLVTHVSQFVYHDITFGPSVAIEKGGKRGVACEDTCENDLPCFPIQLTIDPLKPKTFKPIDKICLPFVRVAASCDSSRVGDRTPSPRAQIDILTSSLDLSNLYGSTKETNEKLFPENDPTARHTMGVKGADNQDYLPFASNASKNCGDIQSEAFPCFIAGEPRANSHMMLMTMHTLVARVHNRIAGMLLTLNPSWIRQRDRLYQETRRLMVALWQHIIYEEFLPIHLGQNGMMKLGVYSGFDPNVDFSGSNEASSAIARQGHYRIREYLFRIAPDGSTIHEGHLPFHKTLFNSLALVKEGGTTPILRGAFMTPAKQLHAKQAFNWDLAHKFMQTKTARGSDLAALDIQRNREFALTGYNRYRVACGLQWAHTFDDLKHEFVDAAIRDKLENLYGYPDNIDLGVAIGLETPVDGSNFGPVGLCFITEQFKSLRNGDRFFYRNKMFTPDQMKVIESMSIAKLICLGSSNLETISRNAFLRPHLTESTTCTELVKEFDLAAWKDI